MLRSCYTHDTYNGDDDVLRRWYVQNTWHKGNLTITWYIYSPGDFLAAAEMANMSLCPEFVTTAERTAWKLKKKNVWASWLLVLELPNYVGIWKPFECKRPKQMEQSCENHILAKWTNGNHTSTAPPGRFQHFQPITEGGFSRGRAAGKVSVGESDNRIIPCCQQTCKSARRNFK